ncbi:GCN5 family acetyltransferase, partial [Vibrio cholerae]
KCYESLGFEVVMVVVIEFGGMRCQPLRRAYVFYHVLGL